jgi:segregation and condensation protein A
MLMENEPAHQSRPHMLGAAYLVALPAFQGPLDLLLQLIEKEELDISLISLVAVTDQYLCTIEQIESREPGALADFLVIASKLLYIKSRSLLPRPQPVLEGEEEDASDALIRQLLAYRQFKAVATGLQERQELGWRSYLRPVLARTQEKHLDLSNVDLAALHTILQRVLERMPGDPPLPRVKTYAVTVADQMEMVRALVAATQVNSQGGRLSFRALLSRQTTRLEVIVTFLAVLELVKQQEVAAQQDELFGEIELVALS